MHPHPVSRHAGMDPLLLGCVAVALLLHILLIFWLGFVAPRGDRAQMQDVTVAVRLSPQKNTQADYLAQASQQGSGQLQAAQRQTTPTPNRVQQDGQQARQALPQPLRSPPQQATQAEQLLLTQLSWKREQERRRQQRTPPAPQAQTLDTAVSAESAQMAALEAQYAQLKQQYARITRIQTVDTVATQAADSAAYLERFRRQVERAGNRDVLALQSGVHGDVRLMVILQADGSIRAIRLLASSGNPRLDEAAKNSVRRAAPFAPFDARMRNLSELRIIRTWRFAAQQDQLDVRGR